MSTNCVLCKHFYLTMGSPGYSEYTPSGPAYCECDKGHWKLTQQEGTHFDLRAALERANDCADYEHHAAAASK